MPLVLGPLGQGGYSLLVNGENIAELLPLHFGNSLPFIGQTGQMIFGVCFAGSFILWSMGIAWIALAVLSIFSVVKKGKVPFSMAYWGMVFPHGTFAILSVQLAKVLDSPFYRCFGALWCCECFRCTPCMHSDLTSCFKGVVFSLWLWIFVRSIPGFIDGSLFMAPYVPENPNRRKSILDAEEGQVSQVGDSRNSVATSETKGSKTL
jgi:tellurite resistance protein TehA-like permease